MKKYLYLAAFCLLLGPTVSAQNDADKGIEFPHRVVTNGFWDNWFVGVGAGVNVYGGQHDQHMSLGKRLCREMVYSGPGSPRQLLRFVLEWRRNFSGNGICTQRLG